MREMEDNEAVRRALEVWRAEELVKGDEVKRKGEGVVNPAAKACESCSFLFSRRLQKRQAPSLAVAIYEILHATREIAKRQKEDADRLKKRAKKRGVAPPPPPLAKKPQDGTLTPPFLSLS